MTRQVDLRDHGDTERGCVGDHVTDLILSVITTIADAVIGLEVLADHGSVAECSDLGQLGIFLDLNPPTLVLGEMPVKAIEFIGGHDVEVFLNLLDGEEMPGAVKVHASVGESGLVFDRHGGEIELLRRVNFPGEDSHISQLLERLDGIQEAIVGGSLDKAGLLLDVN